ncbi:hypothetical protein ABI59_10195 [Acidobacteria bacterium Mor1]|nr:hypothetical protein ABI59_10195 [Acidobacteria bacterium Mor1]
MANPSFDITTGCDLQEVDNAVNQAIKEIRQRYDFKGLTVAIEFKRDDAKVVLSGPEDFKVQAMTEVLNQKMARRGVPLKNLHYGEIQQAGGNTVKQEIDLQQGISMDTAKAIVKYIKDQKIKKVQAAIQGEQVRVTSPKRDDLQTAIAVLKKKDFGVELRFGNYRGD